MKLVGFTLAGLVAVMLTAFTGCQQSPKAAGTQYYQVNGVIKELPTNGVTLRIAHEEIPGYMAAMTMSLDVKDTNEVRGLVKGDQISFRMVVTDTDGWIDQVRRRAGPTNGPVAAGPAGATNTAATLTNSAAPLRESMRRVPTVEPLAIGQVVPNYQFTNQFGAPLNLEQFRGQALAFTFIFTRCPFPTFCPRINQFFEQTQAELKRQTSVTNWHLLSISFDPEFDTPAVLKAAAERSKYDPARWSFATSDLWNIDGITEQFGVQFWRDNGSINHNLRTVVLDTRGRVHAIFPGNDWSPTNLVSSIQAAAQVR